MMDHDDVFCSVCDDDHTMDPSMVLARWHDQWVCTDCLTAHAQMMADEEREACAPPRARMTKATLLILLRGAQADTDPKIAHSAADDALLTYINDPDISAAYKAIPQERR